MEKIGNSDSSFYSFFEPFRAALALQFAKIANLTEKCVKFKIVIKKRSIRF
jgi:hypothetical protein